MPTDEERREFPHLDDAQWARIEEIRRKRAAGEFPFNITRPETPTFEELVLEQLRQQTAILGDIRDLLAARRT